MRLRDETTGRLREVELLPHMGVYVCGITPYDSAHLGHAFTYTHFDVLVRYLRHLEVEVMHVQNVTDVDDDILRVARERGVDFLELARSEESAFREQMRAIGVADPTVNPWATAYVPAMVEEVSQLFDAGVAYERDGTVFFRVDADPRYGRLSGLSRDEMIELAAERGGHPEDPRKDDPLDFVLWQRSLDDEPSWESPWGRGRPGWHIECSTMARRIIGVPVHIHGGGTDLIFPHHESEQAQASTLPGGEPFAEHWMHTGAVQQAGEKMSKSLGNMTFVNELLERHPARRVRRYLLSHHYASDWTFDEDELAAADGPFAPTADPGAAEPCVNELWTALATDLDTPRALRALDALRGVAGCEEDVAQAEEVLGLAGLDA